MTNDDGQRDTSVHSDELLQRGGIVHDVTLLGLSTLANHGVGPIVEQGVEWLQDQFKHEPQPQVEKAPGYDHDD